jgi:60 kDa SS-A/Ro ribonucleoprotein
MDLLASTIRSIVQKNTVNRAGGVVSIVSEKELLRRFLILGTDENTYYATSKEMSLVAIERLLPYIRANPDEALDETLDVSVNNLAPRNIHALAALALITASVATDDQRRKVIAAVPKIIRHGGELLTFVSLLDAMGSWGRFKRRAIQEFLKSKRPSDLSLTMLKYPQRQGWSMVDVVRLAHPKPHHPDVDRLYRWLTKGVDLREASEAGEIGRLWVAKHLLMREPMTAHEAAGIIREYRPPRELVPTTLLSFAEVWQALIPNLPALALLRALPVVTRVGALDAETRAVITTTLTAAVRRIHPFRWYAAAATYAAGRGRNEKEWHPDAEMSSLLHTITEASFAAYQPDMPRGVRLLVAIDVSGSMTSRATFGKKVYELSAAMAYLFHSAANVILFDTRWTKYVPPRDVTLTQYVASIDATGGGTDLSVPFTYAVGSGEPYDAIVVFTDNETWANQMPIGDFITKVFRRHCPKTKVVIVAMTATHYSVAPSDSLVLNVAGFDVAAPTLIERFVGVADRRCVGDDGDDGDDSA